MAETKFRNSRALALVLAGAFGLAALPALAQGLDSEGAIDTIIGSDVKTEEKSAVDESERVIAAIEATMDNAQLVRRAFNIDEVEIVFLPEVGPEVDAGDSGITEKREEFADQIVELQQSIEGSAIFYHAVDSRQILVRDIVAIEFANENRTATIFVAGAAPEGATSSTGGEDETAPAEADTNAAD
ncbi:MAG: hypothetical protein IBJ07_08110 [Rhizobiaceae bacterium]|nr:hypothetical protein [Rhizobiaceae bacterium]